MQARPLSPVYATYPTTQQQSTTSVRKPENPHFPVNSLTSTDGLAYIASWSTIESALGIIAGSAPALKPIFRRYLSSSAHASSNPSKKASKTTNQFALSNMRRTNITATARERDADMDDADSQKGIMDHGGIMMRSELQIEENWPLGETEGKKSGVSSKVIAEEV